MYCETVMYNIYRYVLILYGLQNEVLGSTVNYYLETTLPTTGPMDTYSHPITTSQGYGWWIKIGGHSPGWSKNEAHVHVNSEMTR